MKNEQSIHMLSLVTSYRTTQILHVAAVLGIADHLANGPRSIQELASLTATHSPSLYRIMRSLSSIGVFREDGDKVFSQTPLSATLKSDETGSMRSWAIMVGGEHHWRAWEELLHTVKTGEPAFEHVFGTGPFEYYSSHPEALKVFHGALSGLTEVVNPAIIRSYDFTVHKKIVDIGGGQGSLLAGLLAGVGSLQGIIFDLPDVISRAEKNLQPYISQARCELISGNFFDSIPAGGDVYLMKHILHDWNDEQSITILRNCRKAMKSGAKVLIVEMIISEDNTPSYAKMLDIEMLSAYRGKERTPSEYETLLTASGFRMNRIIQTDALVGIVEGIAIDN